jgi:hypothetical protein
MTVELALRRSALRDEARRLGDAHTLGADVAVVAEEEPWHWVFAQPGCSVLAAGEEPRRGLGARAVLVVAVFTCQRQRDRADLGADQRLGLAAVTVTHHDVGGADLATALALP